MTLLSPDFFSLQTQFFLRGDGEKDIDLRIAKRGRERENEMEEADLGQ